MVNVVQVSEDRAAERALALGYAPADRRAALTTLFALDARLREIVRVARDPLIGLMRLTWWGEALAGLDKAPPPTEPLLQALAAQILPLGVLGAELASVADAWSRLLEPEAIDLDCYAKERGATLFGAAAKVLGQRDERAGPVSQGWALTELARDRPAIADESLARARALLAGRYVRPWPRALRPLGALGLLARSDIAGNARPGDPRRVGRLLAHRLTGR